LVEVLNYSFIGMDEFKAVMLDQEEGYNKYISIANPINEDFSIMRTSLLPSLLGTLKNNINRNIKDAAVFEIANIYTESGKELPAEPLKLGILLSGRIQLKGWMEEERESDFFDVKGIIESLTDNFYVDPEVIMTEREYRFFRPRMSADIVINGIKTGIIGKVHPTITENMDIGQDVYFAELDLNTFNDNIKGLKTYKKISSFPSIEIDIAIVVDKEVTNENIVRSIRKSGSGILRNIKLFDIYEGEQIEKGKKSMAYSLSFWEEDRTLKDREVEIIVNRIVEGLEKEFNASLRS
jgi:phenylalanyl-tRNA synthetase beta chain